MHLTCPRCSAQSEIELTTGEAAVNCPECGASIDVNAGATIVLGIETPQLGRFEIIELAGSGTFGKVYKARDPKLNRIVAIKVPDSALTSSAEVMERFMQEARVVAGLRHPGIVPIYEIGETAESVFIVSEFVDGRTLAQEMSTRRFEPSEAGLLIAAIADSLQCAHDNGIIHRDVKPSNIMFDQGRIPRLMDFGLAKQRGSDAVATAVGEILGTPAYMSPEQAGGAPNSIDHRADIYSLGTVLYELLTGTKPFEGSALRVLAQLLQSEPPRPRTVNPQIPEKLESICLKAMAKQRDQRYATAADFATALRTFAAGTESVSSIQSTRSFIHTRGIAVAVLTVVVVVAMFLINRRPDAADHDRNPVSKSKSVEAAGQTVPAAPQEVPQPSPPAEPKKLPTELQIIPRDAVGFISLNLTTLPGETLSAESPFAPWFPLHAELRQKEFASKGNARPTDPWFLSPHVLTDTSIFFSGLLQPSPTRKLTLDRVTQVFLDEPASYQLKAAPRVRVIPPSLLIFTAREKMTPEAAFPPADYEQRTYKGHSYFVSKQSEDRAFYFVDDCIRISGTAPGLVRQFLDRLPQQDAQGPLSPALEQAAAGRGLVVGINPAWTNDERFGIGLPAPFAVPELRPLSQFTSATLAIDFESPDEKNQRWNAELQLEFENESAATQALPAVKRSLDPQTNSLNHLLQFDSPIPGISNDWKVLELAIRSTWLFRESLKSAQIEQQQSKLRLAWQIASRNTSADLAMHVGLSEVSKSAQLRLIGFALHDFEDNSSETYRDRHFPPPYRIDATGRPLLSWRVLLLPYLGEKELFDKFQLDEPWDSPINFALISQMPAVYGDATSKSGHTKFRAVVGPDCFFTKPSSEEQAKNKGIAVASIVDGFANTIAVAVARDPVIWTKPDELDFSNIALSQLGSDEKSPSLAVFADGHVDRLPPGLPEDVLRALFTRNQGEILGPDNLKVLDVIKPAAEKEDR